MKALLLVLLFALPSFAQDSKPSKLSAPGCGPADAKFDVTTTKKANSPTKAEPGRALVFFLQDDVDFESSPRPTTLLGLDGKWIGATRPNSYFYFSVDPGEHHLCTYWQSFVAFGAGHAPAALHFTAEPGGIYYFRAKDIYKREHRPRVKFEQLDSDEGALLTGALALSISHPKK